MPLLSEHPSIVDGVDYIVPFPYGSNVEFDDDDQLVSMLSLLSRMAIGAGVEVWKRNRSAKLVIAGNTPYPDDFPDTTELMVDRARSAGVSAGAIADLRTTPNGTPLNTTYLQAEAARDFINAQDRLGRTLSIPLAYHQARASQACEAVGFDTDFVTAESVLEGTGLLDAYRPYLPLMANSLKSSERNLRLLGRIDRRGKLVNALAKHTGSRMVDVVEDQNGAVIVEKTTATKKLKQMKNGDVAVSRLCAVTLES